MELIYLGKYGNIEYRNIEKYMNMNMKKLKAV